VAAVPILGLPLGGVTVLGVWTYFAPPFDLLAASFDDSALTVNTVTVARWLGPDAGGFVGATATDAKRLQAARGRVIERTIVSTTAADQPACQVEAEARLKELTRAAITATATVEGDPRLVGDVRIALVGEKLGRFAGAYYVGAATHRFGTDGYTTELQLSSEQPEAVEVYRPQLSTEGALTPEQTEGGTRVPTCGEGPTDYAAEWPEFGGPLEGLLVANGLPAGAAHATCGPIAAAGMLKAYGIATDPGKLAALAYRGDSSGKWWTGEGMAGPDSEVKLLVAAGLTARNLGADTAEAIKRTSACQPVIFDTPNHYLLASAYRADQRFFVGVTGSNALHGGSDWMSLAEIAANSGTGGAVRAVIVADAPAPMTAGANQAVDPTGLPSLHVDGRTHQAFVDTSKPLAYAWEKQTGVPALVMMAISASECGWGGAKGNMLFALVPDGSTTSATFQTSAGPIEFRTYPDANGAYKDFVDLVTHGRYANAYANLKRGGSGEQFVRDLQSAGYAGHHNAEDENWSKTVISLMRDVQALL
jgi:hypothetical protein